MGGLVNRMLEAPLPYGRLVDLGMREYGEFACSAETAAWLQAGGMTSVDGRRVRVEVVDFCEQARAASGVDNVICAIRDAA